MNVHPILVVMVGFVLTWWQTLFVNASMAGKGKPALSEILSVTETPVRMEAPAVTLETHSPVTVQRNMKAALVSSRLSRLAILLPVTTVGPALTVETVLPVSVRTDMKDRCVKPTSTTVILSHVTMVVVVLMGSTGIDVNVLKDSLGLTVESI